MAEFHRRSSAATAKALEELALSVEREKELMKHLEMCAAKEGQWASEALMLRKERADCLREIDELRLALKGVKARAEMSDNAGMGGRVEVEDLRAQLEAERAQRRHVEAQAVHRQGELERELETLRSRLSRTIGQSDLEESDKENMKMMITVLRRQLEEAEKRADGSEATSGQLQLKLERVGSRLCFFFVFTQRN